ncbi:DUF3305 domain-containing protein [Gemmobacter nectariphilus]|uniref:DUF3305 domain-containing protein n=1 Tax=Gemmobacter nectariphilus TaxID=220343 RepID=UPI0003F951BD|nr:DUF3305 domain-containing protein [Gemmobacter nectariphilus]
MSLARTIPLAVLARSFPPPTRWAGRVLHPSSLMMPPPPLGPRSRMATTQDGVETWFIGPATLVLHPGDAANMRQNLAMAPPRIWVSLANADDPARVAIHTVTADPFEGEAMATDPDLTVAALPMPPDLREHIAAFAALFPEEERFRKKRRSSIEAEDPGLIAPRILPGGYRPGGRRGEGQP